LTHLFDTSALLAFYFDEAGAEDVSALLAAGREQNAVCCITSIEFWSRLKHLGSADRYPQEWAEFDAILSPLPVNADVVNRAMDIRQACDQRLPMADLLIAATAAHADLTLVHRDPHFLVIPKDYLRQRFLAELS
jgi:predicted nucleic acid-binding protein